MKNIKAKVGTRAGRHSSETIVLSWEQMECTIKKVGTRQAQGLGLVPDKQ